MSSKNIKIFDQTGCLSEEALVEYAHGHLDIHLKKQVEIHINECDFCRDALEGISLMKSKESSRAAIAQLNEKILNHGKPQSAGGKVILMNYWRVAAAVTLFIVLGGGVMFVALNPAFKKDVAHKETEEKEKVLAENKQPEAPKPDEQITDTVSAVFEPAPPKQEEILLLEKQKDENSDVELVERIENGASGNGAAAQPVTTEDISAKDFTTMTATGGTSNAAPSYYNPQGWTATQAPGTFRDSVFTFDTDKYLSDDVSGVKNLETSESLSTVEITSSQTKSSAKKSQKETDEKAKSESKAKAESEKKARQQAELAQQNYKEVAKAEEAPTVGYDTQKVAEEKQEVDESRKDVDGEARLAEAKNDEGKVFAFVEQMPEYPGGAEALKKYIAQNIQYPQAAREKSISGTVHVSYIVTEKGKVTNVKVFRSVDENLDREALRVVSSIKGYAAGKQGGKPVSVQMNIPVKFSLE